MTAEEDDRIYAQPEPATGAPGSPDQGTNGSRTGRGQDETAVRVQLPLHALRGEDAAPAPPAINPMLDVMVQQMREFISRQYDQVQQTADFLQQQLQQLSPPLQIPQGRVPASMEVPSDSAPRERLAQQLSGLVEELKGLQALPRQLEELRAAVQKLQEGRVEINKT